MEDPSKWVGRTESVQQLIVPEPAQAMGAVVAPDVEVSDVGWQLPALWHWAYFRSDPRARLGADGHPERGGLLPPSSLPRRMAAGGTVRFPGSLRVGRVATRVATVTSVVAKIGASGPLLFVTVTHEYRDADGVQILEEQDIVYREAPTTPWREDDVPGSAPEAEWTETVRPDPVTLFRFSAATGNSHRIHYDHPYATDVEGYPALVVHGPLLACWLAALCQRHRPAHRISSFRYRARAPLFAGDTVVLTGSPQGEGRSAALAAYSAGGRLAMTAVAEWASE